jgi:hypothetical protein
MNVTRFVLLRLYIFRGERLWDDYIKFYKLGICMAMQKKPWMTSFLFKEFVLFFKKYVLGQVSFTNKHLLILDGHENHVTLETILETQEMGLHMVTPPSHTSHVFQPLDFFCFKPLETTFRRVRNVAISRNNHMEPNKITLVGCIN